MFPYFSMFHDHVGSLRDAVVSLGGGQLARPSFGRRSASRAKAKLQKLRSWTRNRDHRDQKRRWKLTRLTLRSEAVESCIMLNESEEFL